MNSTNPLELRAPIGQSKKVSKWKKELTIPKILATILLILATLFFIFPFYWVVSGAFKLQTVATTIPRNGFRLSRLCKTGPSYLRIPLSAGCLIVSSLLFVKWQRFVSFLPVLDMCLPKSLFLAEGLFLRCLLPQWHCLSKLFLSRCLRCLQILVGSIRIKGLFYRRLAGHLESS